MDKLNTLTPEILHIVRDKGTETPNAGQYNLSEGQGTYLCRQCGLALFRSDHKFISSCGWPSFDDEISDTIRREPDRDGRRTEILCQRCEAHLGHVFTDENLTGKNLRHCVNSLAIDFVLDTEVEDTEEAIYAGGCFWGVQYLLDEMPGVVKTEVGYIGGQLHSPSYQRVCSGETGHLEAVRVLYDPSVIGYEALTKFFLEIHNPTQRDGQGPDIGEQYLSAVFYLNNQQRDIVTQLLSMLSQKGLSIVTQVRPATIFWSAEAYHQKYYHRQGKKPYCHIRTKRFDDG